MKSFVEFLKEESDKKYMITQVITNMEDLITQVKTKIKDIGIDARVRQAPVRKYILQVYTKTLGSKFSEDEKQKITGILRDLGLKGPMGTDLSKIELQDSDNIEGHL